MALMLAGFGTQLAGWLDTNIRPSESAFGAVVYTFVAWQGFFAVVLTLMGLYTLTRSITGRLDAVRRVTFDNTKLFWHYATVQALVGLVVAHGFSGLVQATS